MGEGLWTRLVGRTMRGEEELWIFKASERILGMAEGLTVE